MPLRTKQLLQSKYPFYEYHMIVFISFLIGVFLGNYSLNFSDDTMVLVTTLAAIATLFVAIITYIVSIESKSVAQTSLSFANVISAKDTIGSVRDLKKYAKELYDGPHVSRLTYDPVLERLNSELQHNSLFIGALSNSTDKQIKTTTKKIAELKYFYKVFYSVQNHQNPTTILLQNAGNQYDKALNDFENFCDNLESTIRNDCYPHR